MPKQTNLYKGNKKIKLNNIDFMLTFHISTSFWSWKLSDNKIFYDEYKDEYCTYYSMNCERHNKWFAIPESLDPSILKLFLERIKEHLQTIQFDNVTGTFIRNEIIVVENILNEVFPDEDDECCCVCSEKCKNKTPCNHVLCVVCWRQVIETNNKNDNEELPSCPLCRGCISYKHNVDWDDE